ncbi:uncharacterized protein LOC124273354 isoform X2 [Haliotis rubra]|uniref:uncharacterized protein LOC124273354 isoform X2 n=1 Tax=Haliotis rubra TaxID=36100 RepID=UPI001EE523E7|nr:uncharacterized protein LOC124273354 isoform X2 [Haliotis rubra]
MAFRTSPCNKTCSVNGGAAGSVDRARGDQDTQTDTRTLPRRGRTCVSAEWAAILCQTMVLTTANNTTTPTSATTPSDGSEMAVSLCLLVATSLLLLIQ